MHVMHLCASSLNQAVPYWIAIQCRYVHMKATMIPTFFDLFSHGVFKH